MEDQPAGGGDGFDLFRERFEINLSLFELSDEADEIGQIPPQPVKSPHDEGVTLAQTSEAGLQLRPLGVFAGGLFFVNLAALGPLQSVPLQIQGLVFGRDTSVADAHVPNHTKRAGISDIDSGTSCETLLGSKIGLDPSFAELS